MSVTGQNGLTHHLGLLLVLGSMPLLMSNHSGAGKVFKRELLLKSFVATGLLILLSLVLVLVESQKDIMLTLEEYTEIVRAPVGSQIVQLDSYTPVLFFVIAMIVFGLGTKMKQPKRQ